MLLNSDPRPRGEGRTRRSLAVLAAAIALIANGQSLASPLCPDEQPTSQIPPSDSALCAELETIVRQPSALPLAEYETKVGEYLRNFCHRDLSKGWEVDKYLRNTGPFTAQYRNGEWSGESGGTHAPAVLNWYSPEMYQWLKANRPETHPAPAQQGPAEETALPDGAIIVKEMYTAPAARCADIAWEKLRPDSQGAIVMVRDGRAAHDGWFWGWFGWNDWQPDGPDRADAGQYPSMGFGLYCTNCHSSAKNGTFASLRNIQGEPGEPLVYLSQNFFLGSRGQSPRARQAIRDRSGDLSSNPDIKTVPNNLHKRLAQSFARERKSSPESGYIPDFLEMFGLPGGPPARNQIKVMPSETYDHVWAKAGERTAANQFLTSDQCVGCHSAGSTGLQLDITEPGNDAKLINASASGSWRGSPMALSGRDPFFFAQMESETRVFHPQSAALIQDTCLACHASMGQRQFAIDRHASTGQCDTFGRETLNATPFSRDDPLQALRDYAALSRDGVSCATCHQMALGTAESTEVQNQAQNSCMAERQRQFNDGLNGFAKTFTGNFLVGSPATANGPFRDPKHKPMHAAIGIKPVHNENIKSSELCASCHTVRLPVLQGGRTIEHVYEQTTYPEWAFSAYRTGNTPEGPLPGGAGAHAQSCQDCHMPNRDAHGVPYRSKIAAIQEHSNFPQAEHLLPSQDIDLPVRSDYAKHTLVGLNVFLMRMAWSFPDILGITREDRMLEERGIESLVTAERDMVDQARHRTASISVSEVKNEGGVLNARVAVVNRAGHKFPSGVGMRRAFIQFEIFDVDGKLLWSSGRTNGAGVIVDQDGKPIAGELWWEHDCSSRIAPLSRLHQPHHQVISRQDQAQIYEELVSGPPAGGAAQCGARARPAGELTTSFLSRCAMVKDNRLLPQGFLPLDTRKQIAAALGAGEDLAEEAGASEVDNDPDYEAGGGDAILYRVPVAELAGTPATVQATLYYQATPPYFLQDRFCTASGDDTRRLYYLAGKLQLAGTAAQDWKLSVVTSGRVQID